jgi:hypothetical protein
MWKFMHSTLFAYRSILHHIISSCFFPLVILDGCFKTFFSFILWLCFRCSTCSYLCSFFSIETLATKTVCATMSVQICQQIVCSIVALFYIVCLLRNRWRVVKIIEKLQERPCYICFVEGGNCGNFCCQWRLCSNGCFPWLSLCLSVAVLQV